MFPCDAIPKQLGQSHLELSRREPWSTEFVDIIFDGKSSPPTNSSFSSEKYSSSSTVKKERKQIEEIQKRL